MILNVNKLLVFFLTTITMFIANLISINLIIDSSYVQHKWIILLIYTVFLAFFVLKINLTFSKRKLIFFLLWECFILSIFFSKLLHEDFSLLQFLLYALFIPVIFFSHIIEKYKSTIMISFIFSVLPLIIPLLFLFENQNTIGILLSIAGAFVIFLLRNDYSKPIYIYITIILSSLLIFASGSRTSLIAFLIISGIQLSSIIIQNNSSLFQIIRNSLLVLTTFFVAYLSWDSVNELFFNKFSTTSTDITGGRMDIWKDIIDTKISMFGRNIDYSSLYNVIHAHNTFIQVLADYGLISFILFLFFIIYIIYKLIRIRSLELTMFFSLHLLLGMTGNLFFIDRNLIAVHIIFFVYLGYLLNANTEQKNKLYNKNL